MTTSASGFSSFSSSRFRSAIHMTRGTSSTGLLSPPASARPSLESPPTPAHTSHGASAAKAPLVVGPLVSPPDSLAGSPIDPDSHLSKFRTFIKSRDSEKGAIECVIDKVTHSTVQELLNMFENYMDETDQADVWDALRVDFIFGQLVIRFATAGHELVSGLLIHAVRSQDYPRNGSSSLVFGGCTNVPFQSGGYKTPDYGIYETKPIKKSVYESLPTIAFEVGYSQRRLSLAKKAAQYICLTLGNVLLVIAIDIVHVPNCRPRKLKSVTWSHWEQDPTHHREARDDETDNIWEATPSPLAYSTVVRLRGTDRRIHIRATETNRWELYPNPEISEINILHRHLFREPSEPDSETVAFRLKTSEIMAAVLEREGIQKAIDDRENVDAKRVLEEYADTVVQLGKRFKSGPGV
ncbi:hypothetical protein EDB85DRAFT_1888153 [Lactarius pseudohatsudake]|nr:hypothetical protein EDB85DRAFT_1888153 [Lactarius pseudohatsudake]